MSTTKQGDYMKKMTDLEKIYAPFGITIKRRKVAYCNNNIIPLLKEHKIDWDMNVKENYIKFGGKRFSISNIENKNAEKYIEELIKDEEGFSRQSILQEFQ